MGLILVTDSFVIGPKVFWNMMTCSVLTIMPLNYFFSFVLHKYNVIRYLLCISTSELVLFMPFAGQIPFLAFLILFALLEAFSYAETNSVTLKMCIFLC